MILLTGAPRSGTTWLGKGILSNCDELGYVHEPFNLNRHNNPEMYFAKFDNWFTMIDETNEHLYIEGLLKTLNFKYNFIQGLRRGYEKREALHYFKTFLKCKNNSLFNKRPLMKDPIAVLSAEWLARKLNMEVIFLIS